MDKSLMLQKAARNRFGIAPVCPHFTVCGGCDLQDLPYEQQLARKMDWIRNRLTFSTDTVILDIIPAPFPFGYRNRITLHHNKKQWGFFRRHSHEIVEVRHCPIASDALNQKLACLGNEVLHGPAAFELREDNALGFVQVNSAMNGLLIQEVLRATSGRKRQRILELYAGSGNFTFPLAAQCRQIIAIEGHADAVRLAEERRLQADFAADSPAATEWGSPQSGPTRKWLRRESNTITDSSRLRDRVGEPTVWAHKEVVETRVKHHDRIRFRHAEVHAGVHQLLDAAEHFDTILCDPPREGLGPVARLLERLQPTLIVLVSCDLEAFARDARTLKTAGFILRCVTPLDVFPQTRHIELIGEFISISPPVAL